MTDFRSANLVRETLETTNTNFNVSNLVRETLETTNTNFNVSNLAREVLISTQTVFILSDIVREVLRSNEDFSSTFIATIFSASSITPAYQININLTASITSASAANEFTFPPITVPGSTTNMFLVFYSVPGNT